MATCGEEQQDVNKELEALEQYEKELQNAKEVLKQEDEVRVKDECDESKRKELEERDRFIKDLKDKIKKKEELKQMKKDKDGLIARQIKRIQSLEKEVEEQILESEEKLKKEPQKCKPVNNERCEMEEKLRQLQHNTEVTKMSMKTTFEQTIQKVSNTVTGLRGETEPNQELNGNTEQKTYKMTQKMTEEEMKLEELRQNEQSLRERDEQIKSLREKVQARDSEIKALKEDYERQLREKSQSRNTLTSFTDFFAKHLGTGPLKKTIDQLEIKVKTMSDQLQEAEYALKQEKKKREHESTLKDTRLKEQEKYYEQQIKELSKTTIAKIEQLRQENEEITQELKEAKASFKEEKESWKMQMEELRATRAKDKEDVDKQIAICKKDIREEARQFVIEVMRSAVAPEIQQVGQQVRGMGQKLDQKMEGMGQQLKGIDQKMEGMDQKMEGMDQKMEGMDQKMEATNENLDKVKQEVANLNKKIDENKEPSAPPITGEAETESNPAGNSPYSCCAQSKPLSDTNVEPYYDRPIEETGVTEVTTATTNDKDNKT